MPYYAKDNGDGSVSVGQSDDPPVGAIFKRVNSWPSMAWRPGEHIKVVDGKTLRKNRIEIDAADETEPRFSLVKSIAKEGIDSKTAEIIAANPGREAAANIVGDGLKADIDNAVTIEQIRTATNTNIDR